VIDDRKESRSRGFQLPGVTDGVVDPEGRPRVPLFLNGITKEGDTGEPTNFYFAYPNIYFVNDGESVLITHGHYLEAYWSLAGEWLRKIAADDLDLGQEFDVGELVALNVPLCQLACTGIGQAGPLTDLVYKIQAEAKRKDTKRIKKYLDNLDNCLDDLSTYHWYAPGTWGRELLTDLVANKAKKAVLEAIEGSKATRYNEEFIEDYSVQARFKDFYKASWAAAGNLEDKNGKLDLRLPRKVILGHTHQPTKWKASNAPVTTIYKKSVRLYNTGGWLWKVAPDGNREFCGAEVFTYDSNTGFSSHAVQ
jgi:UDP-2,3-diacylglucosamine pyrophosphatase LpxH